MAWKSTVAPATPQNLTYTQSGTNNEIIALQWDAVAEAERYGVYRVQSDTAPNFSTAIQDARNLLAVTGMTRYTDTLPDPSVPYYYAGDGSKLQCRGKFAECVGEGGRNQPTTIDLDPAASGALLSRRARNTSWPMEATGAHWRM